MGWPSRLSRAIPYFPGLHSTAQDGGSRIPKPGVAGSSPAGIANKHRPFLAFCSAKRGLDFSLGCTGGCTTKKPRSVLGRGGCSWQSGEDGSGRHTFSQCWGLSCLSIKAWICLVVASLPSSILRSGAFQNFRTMASVVPSEATHVSHSGTSVLPDWTSIRAKPRALCGVPQT
jgi:hypothetical protein